jgi:hypothetical protein
VFHLTYLTDACAGFQWLESEYHDQFCVDFQHEPWHPFNEGVEPSSILSWEKSDVIIVVVSLEED